MFLLFFFFSAGLCWCFNYTSHSHTKQRTYLCYMLSVFNCRLSSKLTKIVNFNSFAVCLTVELLTRILVNRIQVIFRKNSRYLTNVYANEPNERIRMKKTMKKCFCNGKKKKKTHAQNEKRPNHYPSILSLREID